MTDNADIDDIKQDWYERRNQNRKYKKGELVSATQHIKLFVVDNYAPKSIMTSSNLLNTDYKRSDVLFAKDVANYYPQVGYRGIREKTPSELAEEHGEPVLTVEYGNMYKILKFEWTDINGNSEAITLQKSGNILLIREEFQKSYPISYDRDWWV